MSPISVGWWVFGFEICGAGFEERKLSVRFGSLGRGEYAVGSGSGLDVDGAGDRAATVGSGSGLMGRLGASGSGKGLVGRLGAGDEDAGSENGRCLGLICACCCRRYSRSSPAHETVLSCGDGGRGWGRGRLLDRERAWRC